MVYSLKWVVGVILEWTFFSFIATFQLLRDAYRDVQIYIAAKENGDFQGKWATCYQSADQHIQYKQLVRIFVYKHSVAPKFFNS